MFSYNAAVAVKKIGYTNIKIYNGGIKDWKKAGYPLDSKDPLPDGEPDFITADKLSVLLETAGASQCNAPDGAPAVTLLDFRNPPEAGLERPDRVIDTACNTIFLQLDDLLKSEVRDRLPRKGMLVSITETGNRDIFVAGFLSKFGFKNITGLKFGMRGWIKKGYPIE